MERLPGWAPLAILIAGFALFWATGGLDAVGLDALGRRYGAVRAWVDARWALSLMLFVAAYAVLVATAVFPAAFALTIAGGVLFGVVAGALGSIAGVTAGGWVAFLAARRALAGGVAGRLGARGRALRDGIARDGSVYLVVLRLTPLLPFWLVTLAAAAAGLSARQYLTGTAIGVVPACFVFANLGAGVGRTWAMGGQVTLGGIASSPELLAPLAVLAVVSFMGLGVRAIVRRRRGG